MGRRLLQLRDEAGNVGMCIDPADVAYLNRQGSVVKVFIRGAPVVMHEQFPDEEQAKRWANTLAAEMGRDVPRG